MTIGAFHLILLGTLVSIGGALLIAKPYWRPAVPETASPTPVPPANPSLIRHELLQHFHAMAGARWLTIGALALFIGVTRGGEAAYFFGPWVDGALHVVILSASWAATIVRTKGLSHRAYLDKMLDLHRKGFELHHEYLTHGGYRRAEMDTGVVIQESVRERRLSEASGGLDQIGRAIEAPRRSAEGDRQYAERLRPLFANRKR